MAPPADPNASSYDTVVVGAGPAGCMASLGAAARGRVLLIDASSIPRNKSCGGMLNEYAQEFIAPFGDLPHGLIREPRYVHFRYVDWDRRIDKPTELRFLNVDRVGFDEWLLTRLPSSVELAESTTLIGYEQDETGVDAVVQDASGPRQVRCRNLVGADGARSTVRRALGAGTVATYVTLQDFCRVEGELEPFFDCIYMRDIGDSFAYAYAVPKGDVAIVGSVFYPKTKRPHEKQDVVLSALRSRIPALGQSRKREACAALSVRSTEDIVTGKGRVLLAGEAAGFMSPTSGEGISYALNAGRLAGEAIAANAPDEALAAYTASSSHIARNIRRKLRWLPFMESSAGKYLAGYVPTPLVSRVTKGL
jgi:flavin-dependent dehydrogenase